MYIKCYIQITTTLMKNATVVMMALWLVGHDRSAAGEAGSDSPRGEISLADGPWRVWLDEQADWRNDVLFAPGATPPLKTLPVHPPTGGWPALADTAGKACALPASVEEYFSGGTNTWDYHGVSWFWRDGAIPAAWRGRVVRLHVEKARLRGR